MSNNSELRYVRVDEFNAAFAARKLVGQLTSAVQYAEKMAPADVQWYQSLLDQATAKYKSCALHDVMEEVATLYETYRLLDVSVLLNQDVSYEDVRTAVRAYEAHPCRHLFEELVVPHWA